MYVKCAGQTDSVWAHPKFSFLIANVESRL
jgi:hypothetical protein